MVKKTCRPLYEGSGFSVQGLGFRVSGLGFTMEQPSELYNLEGKPHGFLVMSTYA